MVVGVIYGIQEMHVYRFRVQGRPLDISRRLIIQRRNIVDRLGLGAGHVI